MFSSRKTAAPSSGYNLTKSLRFRSSATAYLSRTQVSSPTNNKKFTFSTWVKRGPVASSGSIISAGTGGSAFFELYFEGQTISVENYLPSDVYTLRYSLSGSGTTVSFRDPAAWYHIVLAVDTTQASGADGIKIYINGVQRTWNYTGNYVQNSDFYLNQASIASKVGSYTYSATGSFDGYQTEVNFIDGQQLTPSSFGSTNALTGVWQPAKYTGTYGNNGFYLPFTDVALTSGSNAGLGKDFSGNGNYLNTNNISVTAGSTYDSMNDVPTLTSATTANYAVWNPLVLFPNTTYQSTMSNANMLMTRSGGGQGGAVTTIGTTSGKFYAEMPVTAVGGSVTKLGVVSSNNPPSMNSGSEFDLGGTSVPASIAYRSNGARLTNGTTTNSWGSTYTTGDVIGVAFDADTGKIWFAKNNTWQASGDPAAGTNPATTVATGAPFYFSAGGESGISISLNCGQQPFSYTPPTGFVALNTYNLPTSTIVKGNTVMDATLWTGNGSSQTITNAGAIKPDLVWLKERSSTSFNWLTNSVTGNTKILSSNSTDAEATETQGITSFNSNGFSVGSNGGFNENTQTYVGWQWQAGQGSSSSNTSGSITSTVSVNATAGFSVVTYTGNGTSGATVGHGLGVAPKMIIIKRRDGAEAWPVYHASLPSAAYYLRLQATDAQDTATSFMNNTAPSSSVFTLGNGGFSNTNTWTYVAYCWSEIAGFSKFGSYTGNGSTDGPFVYTGFRPKFIIRKSSTLTYSWYINDTAENPYNVVKDFLAANTSDAQVLNDTNYAVDILSNGFKVRSSHITQNNNGDTYIYMAFAENPFKNALAR